MKTPGEMWQSARSAVTGHWKFVVGVVVVLLVFFLLWQSGAAQRAVNALSGLIRSDVEKRLQETEDRLKVTDDKLQKEEKRFEAERKRLRESIAKKDAEIKKRDTRIVELSQEVFAEASKRRAIEDRLAQELSVKRTPAEIHERLKTVGHVK